MSDDPRGARYNSRSNADDAYAAFMSMGRDEFRGALFSILRGGCFEPQEQIGFERALRDRPSYDEDLGEIK